MFSLSSISTQQSAFIKNKFMGEGGRLISHIVDICNRNNIGRHLVTRVIEKAFDSLDHKFTLAALKKMALVKKRSPGLRHY